MRGIVLGWFAAVALTAATAHAEKATATRPQQRSLEIDQCIAIADSATAKAVEQASARYDRGLVLYEQGDYRGAIDEFVAAWCAEPSYTVLKDIAQAYERMVDYELAVAYLERYISEVPDSQADDRRRQSYRAAVLRNLPARIRVATVPANAQVTLADDTGIAARGHSGDEEPLQVRSGTYSLEVQMPGYEPVRETIRPEIGQPYSYYFRLEPQTGSVRIIANSETARIFVDQKLIGLGRVVETLPIGSYKVAVESEQHQPHTESIEVVADRTMNLTVQLKPRPRSGRSEILAAGGFGGGILGSVALGTVLDNSVLGGSIGAAAGLGIGVGGVYFGAPRDIPVGWTSYIIGSSIIGSVEGAVLYRMIRCWNDRACNDASASVTSAALLGAVAGLGISASTASTLDPSAGDAAIVNSGAFWGTIAGALFVLIFDSDQRSDEILLATGLNLGVATGITLARRYELSRAHVALIDLSGLAGIIGGLALVDIIQQGEESERVPHYMLGGLTLGLITGVYLTRNFDEPAALKSVTPAVGGATDTNGETTLTFGLRGSF